MIDEKKGNVGRPKSDGVIFFCESPKAKFAGFKKEKKFADGSIDQPDVPIAFEDCLFIAKTPKEISFMRKITEGDTISASITKECKDMAEWNILRQARELKRAGMASVDIKHALNDDNFDLKSDAADEVTIKNRASA